MIKKSLTSTFHRLTLFLNCSIFCLLFSCKSIYTAEYPRPKLVDNKAEKNVQILRKELFYISKNGFAIGHQDATSYGLGWLASDNPEVINSDVNNVLGVFPAVYGFDIGGIEKADPSNLDRVPFNTMRKLIIEAYKSGGIITISWHLDNPATGGNSWDKTPAVNDILTNPETSALYDLWVDRAAEFLNSLTYEGKKIPIIFRPYHEMNGAWFWWGDPNSTSEDYKLLWKRTVDQLKNKHKLHNLLYAYSPNKIMPDDNYLKYYPGDDYVDILGIDIYDRYDSLDYMNAVVSDLALVRSLAIEKDKIYAFTETGLEMIQTPNWFSEVLYPSVKDSGISWILFWRNHKETHHYMPFKGHISEEDFKKFKDLPQVLFLDDINNINTK